MEPNAAEEYLSPIVRPAVLQLKFGRRHPQLKQQAMIGRRNSCAMEMSARETLQTIEEG